MKNKRIKHIGRNPRFDHEQHWAEVGNIVQKSGTLGRHLKKTEGEKKVFFLKCITKSNVIKKKFGV